MVLTLRRRLNSEVNDPPVLKRKVFEVDTKSLIQHEVVEFHAGSPHSEGILQHLNMFRDNRLFTDTIIKVGDKEFHCHRALLAACSPYFRAMFSNDVRERHDVLIEINGVSAEMMDTLLSFMYTAHAEITTKNVEHLYEASSLFQITALGNACAMFLETQMDPCNCLGFMLFAEKHFLKELASNCRNYARANFSEVVQHEEFLNLQHAELIKYIDVDDLCASKEEMVFEAVMRWVYNDVEKRRSALKDLLEHVRLPLLHPTYFIQTVERDCLIQNSSECYDLLHEARRYHVLGNEMMSPRTRPRRSTGVSEVIVVVGGCERAGGFNLPYTECYDPVSGVWKSLTKLPEFTKSEYAVCALRNDILVSGGRINSRDVWMYSSQLHMWMKVASLTRGRWRHKMGVLLGKAYAVGGYDGHNRVHFVECYDSFTNRWTEVAPMIEGVSSPAVTSCTNKLFVIGGGPDDDTCSDKVQCYDPLENTWVLRTSIPTANRCISAVSLNKLIYVYGGLTKDILCYDPTEDTWMTVAQTFCKMESCGMSVCNGKIFILGGRGENSESLDTVLCFDPASGISKCPVKMPRPISHHGCVTVHRYDKEYKISPQPE